MKRLHVHVAVGDLDTSIRFYSTLFGTDPTVLKDDYAKWMLDDPRVEPLNILFLCTGNTARSIMAEAILNQDGGGRFRAFSAGSFPKGHVHRLTLDRLHEEGVSTEGLRSKSWDEFASRDAPRMDVVITVCDSAASETCPVWPGAPITAHWGVTDPAEFGPDRQPEAFAFAFAALRRRIDRLLALPIEALDPSRLQDMLRGIGRTSDPERTLG